MPKSKVGHQLKPRGKNEDGLICPISLELPFDPVMAEDGRIYERKAIKDYFKNNRHGLIKSPVTRQFIGTKLISSPQIKSAIETLIENGAITGSAADHWKEQQKEEKKVENLMKKAEDGHRMSMEIVAGRYYNGGKGFKRSKKAAFKWFEKARAAGSVYGMAGSGDMLVCGAGCTKNMKLGLIYLGLAAGRGSDFAAYRLGLYMADGKHGVPVDTVEAQRLFKKCLSRKCKFEHMSADMKEIAQEKLDELEESEFDSESESESEESEESDSDYDSDDGTIYHASYWIY